MKRILSILLSVGILCASCIPAIPTQAAKIKLNKSTYTMRAGTSFTLKIKGTKAKVKWSSSKKSVATVSKSGKVTAKKAGFVKITAKVKKKKYICEITVKKKPTGKPGSKTNPLSAYKKNTFNYYEEGKNRGKITLQLLSFISGEEAAKMASTVDGGKGIVNPIPTATQEYIYFKFKFHYISGTQTLNAKDIFNYYNNIFDNRATRQMKNIDWGFDFETVDDLNITELSPGNEVICAKAILIDKGYGPVTYRIQTGKTSYTWFTTE